MATLHRLLLRQLKKHCPGLLEHPGAAETLLAAISQSYHHFDANHQLVERAMRLSSEELSSINKRLREETERQQITIQSLKEAVDAVSRGEAPREDHDLQRILDILKEEIEKRNRLELDLVRARESAEEALRTRKLFLANISHEIRTPVNAILGFSGLLAEGQLNDAQREYLDAVKHSAENLMHIISHVLDSSKLESGHFTLEMVSFHLDRLIKPTIHMLTLRAVEKGISLLWHCDNEVNPWLKGDPLRLGQILTNLVGNAVKFTNMGKVELRVELTASHPNHQRLLFSITDTGIGIAPEKIPQLFEPFSQEDSGISRKYGGTGLGLSIASQLVERMGGKIQVESTKGVGSRFWFELEFENGNPLEEKKLPQHSGFDFRMARVLVVDDNELNRYLLTSLLHNYNCETETAASGLEAIELLKQKNFDLVMLDLQMPEKDGFETIRFIRSELKLKLPVIALTAMSDRDEADLAIKAGMDAFISKPFVPQELFAQMNKLLQPKTSGLNGYSLDRVNAMYQHNRAHVRRTIEIFLSQTGSDMHEFKKLLDGREANRLKALLHKLKPNIELFEIKKAEALLEPLLEAINRGEWKEAGKLYQHMCTTLEQATTDLHAYIEESKRQ